MVLILDDSFNVNYKNSDVSFLNNDKYKNLFKLLERPTKKDFRNIVSEFKNIQLLCNHRSLKLFNDKQEVIDGKDDMQNLFNQLQHENISRLEFGRDIHSNFNAKTLDKDVFYTNLKPFLDNISTKEQVELKILFYGENYVQLEYLSAIDKMMDEINFFEINDFKNNHRILDGTSLIFPDSDPIQIIEDWVTKALSKKEIMEVINKNL